jgi:cyclopropane fatty-acyl-phospholipid synthase-like methyltransferase
MAAGNPERDREAEGALRPENLISDSYLKLLIEAHAEPNWGTSAEAHIEDVCSLIAKYGADTVLDYGCGKGVLSQVIDVTNYDPATYPELPNPHDLVLCIDVMEHVEEGSVSAVLSHIASLTKCAAFFVISCQPAVKKLADGRNAHITIQEPKWWRDQLIKHGLKPTDEFIPKGDKAYMVVCQPV